MGYVISLVLFLSMSMMSSLLQAETGTVLETMNAAGYTYAKINDNQAEYWVAGPQSVITVGDTVSFKKQMAMPDFYSKTLNRTFKDLWFVGVISTGSEPVRAISPHPKMIQKSNSIPDPGSIEKAKNGYTVAELFSHKSELKGQSVTVQGQVVKVSNGIMGSNWVHIQDGSGAEGSNDIIFRSITDTANVGDVVLAKGSLKTDIDFGSGYKYAVIVEDASFQSPGE